MSDRPTLAVWKFASCDGCQLALLAEEHLLDIASHLDIAWFAEASSRMRAGPWDVSFVEGSITTRGDAERIRDIRDQSGILVTIGACATGGGIQALRGAQDLGELAAATYPHPDQLDILATSTPISDHVEVDFEIPGCPIEPRQVAQVVSALVAGRRPSLPTHDVCTDCKLRGLACLPVSTGAACLGPVTRGGCGARCPAVGRGCYGCFGPVTDMPVGPFVEWVAGTDDEARDAAVRALTSFQSTRSGYRDAATLLGERRTR